MSRILAFEECRIPSTIPDRWSPVTARRREMWTALLWVGLGFAGFPSADQAPGSGESKAATRPTLAIMSPDPGEFALRLEHHWGGLHANRVYFDNHEGPFEAVVERSADGVRVTFNGWEERPFTASSKKIRVTYHGPRVGVPISSSRRCRTAKSSYGSRDDPRSGARRFQFALGALRRNTSRPS